MKASEFVRNHYPDAKIKRIGSPYCPWHVVSGNEPKRKLLGEGSRESWAWADAKRNIVKLISAQENPVDDGEHY